MDRRLDRGWIAGAARPPAPSAAALRQGSRRRASSRATGGGKAMRFEITERRPFAGGASFGEHGGYEWLACRLHYAVDPANPRNAPITDLALAPRGVDGLVHF